MLDINIIKIRQLVFKCVGKRGKRKIVLLSNPSFQIIKHSIVMLDMDNFFNQNR